MTMTDTDQLSKPSDMVDLLKRLAKIMRDVERLPDNAQQRFWDDTGHSLESTPVEELRCEGTVSMRSVTVFYNILANMCGPRLAEMVNGATKEYYETLLSQMKEMAHRPLSDWEGFLNEQFEASTGTDHDGSIIASVVMLATIGSIGQGPVKRVEGVSKILKLMATGPSDGDRYFSSKDIIMMEIAPTQENHQE